MAGVTPEQRARMLKHAEAQFRARGLPKAMAKRAAKEALRQFIDQQIQQEAANS